MKDKTKRVILRKVLAIISLALLCILVPYIVTSLFIGITGDRIQGMKLGVVPGILITHMVFGMFYLQTIPWLRMLITLLMTAVIYYLLLQSITYELIHAYWDESGFWDLVVTNFLIGAIVWEISYHLVKLLNKLLKVDIYLDNE